MPRSAEAPARGRAGGRWQARSIRARLASAAAALVALAALNVGAFYWGARQRQHVFDELGAAIARHHALTAVQVGLEDHAKRVRVMSDLLGVEQAPLDADERERALASLDAISARLAGPGLDGETGDGASDGAALQGVRARADSLVGSWRAFYAQQARAPEAAIAELVLTAEPLARRLLPAELPAAIAAQSRRVEAASAAFARTDRTSSGFVWAILVLSGVCGTALFSSLARDLLASVGALKVGAERFGAGELGHRVAVGRCDELDEVGESLNTMAARLRQARDELEVRNQELAQLAFRDPLTRLANRALFREHVGRSLAQRGRQPGTLAVLFVDLDNFKAVNDTLGHDAGDRLLAQVAERLLNATRGCDTVARLGGDEFAVLLERLGSAAEAETVAQRIVVAMRPSFTIEGRAMHVGASVGIACAADDSVDELLRNADLAMYRAKSCGKGRHAVFVPEMHAALLRRVELEEELRDAVERGDLALVYQPIVELADQRVVGFEALVRWTHPRLGPVPPSVFIPVAEEAGTIPALGRWVLATACREAASWPEGEGGVRAPGLSVNVSGHQLEEAGFVDVVRAVLAETGLAAARLTLEITESVLMRDSEAMLGRLHELKALGVRLAIDDFGTGYSSLSYLHRFPVDVLKIDKTFVDAVAAGRDDPVLARAIIALGGMLHLSTVAEGIEHREQQLGVERMGCTYGQGYYFSRPIDPSAVRALLADGKAGRVGPVSLTAGA